MIEIEFPGFDLTYTEKQDIHKIFSGVVPYINPWLANGKWIYVGPRYYNTRLYMIYQISESSRPCVINSILKYLLKKQNISIRWSDNTTIYLTRKAHYHH